MDTSFRGIMNFCVNLMPVQVAYYMSRDGHIWDGVVGGLIMAAVIFAIRKTIRGIVSLTRKAKNHAA